MPSAGSPHEELLRRVGEVPRWYHVLDLGHGIVTPGQHDPRRRLAKLGMPEDLSNKTVLDIGAWDGFFSFEAERRGAKRVVAADKWAWSLPDGRRAFEVAREALGSKVEACEIDVLELSPERLGRFDLVLFLGVLYHLRDPLIALERVASVTGHRLILETAVDLVFLGRPAMAFYPGRELDDEETNWWGPNPRAVVAMLGTVGFERIEVVSPQSLAHRVGRGLRGFGGSLRGGASVRPRPLAHAQQGRMVAHAFSDEPQP